MSYSGFYTKENIRIPTILAILIILFITFLIGKYFFTPYKTIRAAKIKLKRHIVTNLTPQQLAVFWQTDEKNTGFVVYGESKTQLTTVSRDERDSNKNKNAYTNHYVVLKNLKANTTYFYKLVVADSLIGRDGAEPFSFTTLPKTGHVAYLQPAYGKVINESGAPEENAIVVLSASTIVPLSALTKSSGEWLISLNYLVDPQTKKTTTLAPNEPLKLEIINESGKSSSIKLKSSKLSPIPDVTTIGKNYDFVSEENILAAQTSIAQSPKIETFDITFPKEGASIQGRNPLIKGVASPGSLVAVKVSGKSYTISSQLRADKAGIWKLTLSQNFDTGSYRLVTESSDSKGQKLTKSRTFIIAKSGEQVLGGATGSATLTATPTPTSSITPFVTSTSPVVSPTSSPPISGANPLPFALISAVLITLGAGLLLAF